GIDDIAGLVELIADFYIGRNGGLHIRQGGFDALDDVPGGGVGAFGNGNIDRTLAIDQCIAGGDVGAEAHGSHIAEIDGRTAAQPERNLLKVLCILDDAVLRGDV